MSVLAHLPALEQKSNLRYGFYKQDLFFVHVNAACVRDGIEKAGRARVWICEVCVLHLLLGRTQIK